MYSLNQFNSVTGNGESEIGDKLDQEIYFKRKSARIAFMAEWSQYKIKKIALIIFDYGSIGG